MPGWGAGCYLLDVLLEDAELQAQERTCGAARCSEPPLVQHFVHHIQHLVHRLGVVGCGLLWRDSGVPGTQGPLQHIQQSFAVLADL